MNLHALLDFLDKEPLMVVLTGSNGAGKSTFYATSLAAYGLPFVNADILARESALDSYSAAKAASKMRAFYVREKRSFVFETVFSDPVGDKLQFMKDAEAAGFTVALIFIGIDSSAASEERVALRVLQGGHDVPLDKLAERFPRTLANLSRSIESLQNVIVFDNSDLMAPYRQLAIFRSNQLVWRHRTWPNWFEQVLAKGAA